MRASSIPQGRKRNKDHSKNNPFIISYPKASGTNNTFFMDPKFNPENPSNRAVTPNHSRRNSGASKPATPTNGGRKTEFAFESGKKTAGPQYFMAQTQASDLMAYSPNVKLQNQSRLSNRLQTSGGISTDSTFYVESPTLRTSSPLNNRFYNTNESMLSRNSNVTQNSNRPNTNFAQRNVYFNYDPYEKCGYYPRSPKFSFASATRSTLADQMQILGKNIPGPGKYDTNKSMLSSLGGTMMSQYADRSLIESARTPSPASYNQNDLGRRRHSPCTVIGTTKRNTAESFIRPDCPSPLDYKKQNCEVVFRRTFRATIGTSGLRRNNDFKANTPGPSSYNIPLSWLTGPAQTIAKAGRDPEQRDESPGPSSYTPNMDVVKNKSFRATIGNASRDSPDMKLYKTSYSPGPTDYDTFNRNYRRSPKATFPTSQKNDRLELSPGPGDYNIPMVFATVPRYLTKN